jgi:tRNA-specific 2-thiouridylase
MSTQKKKVVLGMSGGVDSSVSAHLLKEMGYEVIGLFMKNWEDDPNCPQTLDFEDVLRVCDQLDIPCHSVNFAKDYRDKVFASFLDDLKNGYTPNPDILCNKHIKFDVFFNFAKSLGADLIATGHYAQISKEGHLLKGFDPNKDQTYFLHQVQKDVFKQVLFPIGHMLKPDLRQMAHKLNLATASKKDSTGICFIGKRDFRSFTQGFLGYNKGPIVCIETHKKVGDHEGAAFYTLGQRKGLKIGGEGDAWFVVDKDISKNTLFVAQGEDHPRLYHKHLIATDLNFLVDKELLKNKLTAKVRYRQEDVPCQIIDLQQGQLTLAFDQPQKAITPGQSVVLYHNDICCGGGVIKERF